MNELAQSKHKSKYLAQAYETNGIILVSEYVTVMDKMEFLESQFYIKKILDVLAIDEKKRQYILGDMVMSEKNYGNWGRRMNGDIVVLDYGYLYELTNAEWKEVAKCPTCGSSLEYTKDYSELKCVKPEC
jgi:ssDNA-binding Zn-finger/Zn-ribbon topoisomerase 1